MNEILTYLATAPEKKRVFVDETGFDLRQDREYGGVTKGERVHCPVSGKRYIRVNMIASLFNRGGDILKLEYVFHHHFDTGIFNSWLKIALVTELKNGDVVFIDNASFHKSPEAIKIIEDAGCVIKFLPKYSPKLNPIEHVWSVAKAIFRKIRYLFAHPKEGFDEALRRVLNRYKKRLTINNYRERLYQFYSARRTAHPQVRPKQLEHKESPALDRVSSSTKTPSGYAQDPP